MRNLTGGMMILLVALILGISQTNLVFAQVGSISVSTNYDKVLPGSVIGISGLVSDEDGNPANTEIKITYKMNGQLENIKEYRINSIDGYFNSTQDEFAVVGNYTIIAQPIDAKEGVTAVDRFEIVEFHNSLVGQGIILFIVFMAGILALAYAQIRHGLSISTIEPARFSLLTLCSVIPIVIFIIADIPLGQDTPFGFVRIPSENLGKQIGLDLEIASGINEWVIHLGGDPRDNYSSGIKIPVFVFVFGLIGGYLRILRKISTGWTKDAITKAVVEVFKKQKGTTVEESIEDLLNFPTYKTTVSGQIFKDKDTCHVCGFTKEYTSKTVPAYLKRINEGGGDMYSQIDYEEDREPICAECYVNGINTWTCTVHDEEYHSNCAECRTKLCELHSFDEIKGMEEDCQICERLHKNDPNKYRFRIWKNEGYLKRRFYAEWEYSIFHNSLEDIAMIFIPPILAISTYFILLQAGINAQENMPTVAAVSLGVGLVTREVMARIEEFTKSILGSTKEEETKETSQTEKKEESPDEKTEFKKMTEEQLAEEESKLNQRMESLAKELKSLGEKIGGQR